MSRISIDEWALELAEVTAKRSTCIRRAVGCVLLNARGRVLSTGYNGVASGLPHCNELVKEPIYSPEYTVTRGKSTWKQRHIVGHNDTYPHTCAGAGAASGTQLDACEAVHAEQNALLACSDDQAIATAYVTASPCMSCVKSLLGTSCQRIVFREVYPHDAARVLWLKTGREWLCLSKEGKWSYDETRRSIPADDGSMPGEPSDDFDLGRSDG